VRLKHVDTAAYLQSHDMRYGNPISGQQEVCASQRKSGNSDWFAGEGVYVPFGGGEEKEEL
jgi:dolichyl-phosphate-mannose--protein O-mannosyl transferase